MYLSKKIVKVILITIWANLSIAHAQTALSLASTSTDPICAGSTTGSIVVTASGGTAPYQYQLSEAGAGGWQSGNSFTALGAGTYPVSVKDANSNYKTIYVTLTDPTAITATVVATSASCSNSSDGKVTVSATGGSGSYSYAWTYNSTTITSSNASTYNISGYSTSTIVGPAGSYAVSVTDANGCVGAVTYYNPDTISLNTSSFNQDVIVDSAATSATIASGSVTSKLDNDSTGYVLYQSGFKNSSYGLPTNRIITSAQDNSLTFHLQPYSQNNSSRTLTGGVSTLTFRTPTALAKVVILGTSGNGISLYSFKITFSDDSTYSGTASSNRVSFRDWFATTGSDISKNGLSRIALGANAVATGSNFSIFEAPIIIPSSYYEKKITSITLTNVSSTISAGNIFAVSGLQAMGTSSTVGYSTSSTTIPSVEISSSLDSVSNEYCSGETVTFTATTTHGGTAPTYKWEYSTDSSTWTTSSITTATYTATPTSSKYYVRVTATASSDATCLYSKTSNTTIFSTTLNSNLTPTITITGPTSICYGSTATFNVGSYTNAGNSYSIQWNDNTTSTSLGTGTSLKTSSLTTGTHNIQAVLTSSLSCVTSKTAISNLIPLTVNESLAPTVTIGNINSTAPITFNISDSSNLGTSPSYQWYLNGSSITDATNSTYTASTTSSAGDSYSLKVTSSLSCASPSTLMSNYITIATALPVVMKSFSVTSYTSKVSVDWQTSTEINTNKFEVLRKYQDSSDYKVVATIAATNNASGSTYQYWDYPKLNGYYQYQIKSYDFDGAYQLSDIKSIYFGNGTTQTSSIYPNPFTDQLTIMLTHSSSESGSILLINMSGARVASKSISLLNGTNNYIINNLSNLPSGIYICQIINNQNETLARFKVLKK